MDTFSIIQNFFTRMACHFCGVAFKADDVQLVGEGDDYMIVSVRCHDCGQHNGVAAVGVETHEEILGEARPFKDPEFTEEDYIRLAEFAPIEADDVLEAHEFFQNLGGDWMKFIPPEIRERYTENDTESRL